MTNESNARAVEVFGGFIGEYRLIHKATWHRVLCNGKACVYETASEAEVAAWRELNEKRYPPIRSEGEKVSATRSKAEELFGQIFPGKGRKPIKVDRR
jgi:hypothetical protein